MIFKFLNRDCFCSFTVLSVEATRATASRSFSLGAVTTSSLAMTESVSPWTTGCSLWDSPSFVFLNGATSVSPWTTGACSAIRVFCIHRANSVSPWTRGCSSKFRRLLYFSFRCDNIFHCQDGSDETKCSLLRKVALWTEVLHFLLLVNGHWPGQIDFLYQRSLFPGPH